MISSLKDLIDEFFQKDTTILSHTPLKGAECKYGALATQFAVVPLP
jgi:hypothetical protein